MPAGWWEQGRTQMGYLFFHRESRLGQLQYEYEYEYAGS